MLYSIFATEVKPSGHDKLINPTSLPAEQNREIDSIWIAFQFYVQWWKLHNI